jgi:hypothetical protein
MEASPKVGLCKVYSKGNYAVHVFSEAMDNIGSLLGGTQAFFQGKFLSETLFEGLS